MPDIRIGGRATAPAPGQRTAGGTYRPPARARRPANAEPTREEALAEAYRRGLMNPEQARAYREAARRRLTNDPNARNTIESSGPARLVAMIPQGASDAIQAQAVQGGRIFLNMLGYDALTSPGNPVGNALQAQASQWIAAHVPHVEPPRNETERTFYRVGENAPNALVPGGVGVRVANVLAPAAGGTIGRAVGGDTGETVGTIAGGLLGGLRGGLRAARREPNALSPPPPPSEAATAARAVPGRPRSVQRMRQRQAALQASGANPTMADVVTTGARRRIRDVALRGDESQQTVNDFSAGRRVALPDQMSQHARAHLSSDPRTPDQIVAETAARRNATADQQYGAVRDTPFTMDEPTIAVLRTDVGRQAIRDAARLETNPETRAALNRLANDALDNPNTPVTVGMMDAISRQLLGDAGATSNANTARVLGGFGRDVRGNARAAVPGYGEAVDNYAAESRLMDAVRTGEGFMNPNSADEFAAAVQSMSPEELAAARAGARRTVERKGGENIGAAPGVARRLGLAPEQHLRNVALMGEEGAARFEAAMRAESQMVTNAMEVDPRTGSQTQPNTMQEAQGAVQDTAALLRGNPVPWTMRAAAWFVNRGFSEEDAATAVRMLTDPAQTDAVLAALEARGGPTLRQQAMQLLQTLPQAGKQALLPAGGQAVRLGNE